MPKILPIFDDLSKAVSAYLMYAKEEKEDLAILESIKPPAIPEQITSQEDYDYYTGLKTSFEEKSSDVQRELHQDHLNLNNAIKILFETIPLTNVWFKVLVNVDFYAVAKEENEYEETYRVVVIPWSENLPKLNQPELVQSL